MLVVILTVVWILIELFIALGVLASVSVQACAIIALVGFGVILLVELLSNPDLHTWFHHPVS